MKLYREVRVETADALDQLEEYYVKETDPGAAWQIVLVPIEAEEETTDAGGISLLHGSTRTWPAYRRLVTPWTPTEEA